MSKKNSKVLVFWSLWTKSQKSLFLVLEEKMPKNDCLLFLKKCQKYLVFEKKILKNFCLLVLGKKKNLKNHCFLFLKSKIQKYLSFGPCEKNLYWSSNNFFFFKNYCLLVLRKKFSKICFLALKNKFPKTLVIWYLKIRVSFAISPREIFMLLQKIKFHVFDS